MRHLQGSRFGGLLGSLPTCTLEILAAAVAVVTWVALPTQQGFVALAVLALLGAQAIRKRPPARDQGGRRLRPTTVVNSVAAVGIAAIPIGIVVVSLIGGRSAAPVVLGIGVAAFGLIAFALYSFIWVATRRATLAATAALIGAGILSTLFALPAFLDQLAGRNPF